MHAVFFFFLVNWIYIPNIHLKCLFGRKTRILIGIFYNSLLIIYYQLLGLHLCLSVTPVEKGKIVSKIALVTI